MSQEETAAISQKQLKKAMSNLLLQWKNVLLVKEVTW